jgi:ureidoacrylate peracid hydrolase
MAAAAAAAEPPSSFFRPETARAAREQVPLDPSRTAVLFVDVQRYNLHREGAVWRASGHDHPQKKEAHFARVAECLPRWADLLKAARLSGAEPIFTVIESLTADGRDRGLDYKLSGMHVAKGSPDARVLDEVAPGAFFLVNVSYRSFSRFRRPPPKPKNFVSV